MLRFAHPNLLWLFATLPFFWILFLSLSRWKKRALNTFGDPAVTSRITTSISKSKPYLKFWLFLSVLALLVISLADPQIGSKTEEVKKTGIDLVVLIDVSNSMLSTDLAPNRLELAKRGIAELIDNLHSDRLGLIVFAGEAFVQLPLTSDYASAKLFLNAINPGIVPVQGTAIGAAITKGLTLFDPKSKTSKAMVLMTDGENHEDDAVRAAEAAGEQDISLHVIGFGSSEGSPIPIIVNGKQSGFHLDSAGKTVISKLNEPMCRQLAETAHGIYIRATNAGTGLPSILAQIGSMQQKTYGTTSFKIYEDRFQIFLGLSILLLMLDMLTTNRRNEKLRRLRIFESLSAFLIVPIFLVSPAHGQDVKGLLKQGNTLYEQKRYRDAEINYRKSLSGEQTATTGKFNLGDALFKQKNFTEAAPLFNSLAETAKSPALKASAYHNLGDALFESKKLEESVAAFKKALLNNPKDEESRYNLAYAQHKLDEQKKDNKKQNKDNKKNKPDKNQGKDKKPDKPGKDKDQPGKDSTKNNKPKPPEPGKPDATNAPKPEISKEDAQRMLSALNGQEQATQEKLKNKKFTGAKSQTKKDW